MKKGQSRWAATVLVSVIFGLLLATGAALISWLILHLSGAIEEEGWVVLLIFFGLWAGTTFLCIEDTYMDDKFWEEMDK